MSIHPEATIGWRHLELGAANYGREGHSKGQIKGGASTQFQPLFRTLDELIKTEGQKGIFFLNDLEKSPCEYAKGCLEAYIATKYPGAQIQIRTLPKSYRDLEVERDCKVHKLTSIHLKNPDHGQFVEDVRLQNETRWMDRLVSKSKTGLMITHYYHMLNLPSTWSLEGEKSHNMLRYRISKLENPDYVYVHPDGRTDPKWEKVTTVYHVRLRQVSEIPLQEDDRRLELVKQRLRNELTAQEQEVKKELTQFIQGLQTRKGYRFLRAFHPQLDQPSNSVFSMPISEQLRKIESLNFDILDQAERQTLSINLRGVLARFKHTLQKNLELFETRSIRDILSSDDFTFDNTLHSLKEDSRKTAQSAWERLELGEVYREHFETDEAFYQSAQTLEEIQEELQSMPQTSEAQSCCVLS